MESKLRDPVRAKCVCVCIFVCVYRPDGVDASHYVVRRDSEVWRMREDTAKLGRVIVLVLL